MKDNPTKIFGIDFDGTCVTHMYPDIGRDIGAAPVLHRIVKDGGVLILNTMRSGAPLDAAVKWFKDNEIPLYGINNNPDQYKWTSSPKVYANIYIDDAALGCPLLFKINEPRGFVNWKAVEEILWPTSLH